MMLGTLMASAMMDVKLIVKIALLALC